MSLQAMICALQQKNAGARPAVPAGSRGPLRPGSVKRFVSGRRGPCLLHRNVQDYPAPRKCTKMAAGPGFELARESLFR